MLEEETILQIHPNLRWKKNENWHKIWDEWSNKYFFSSYYYYYFLNNEYFIVCEWMASSINSTPQKKNRPTGPLSNGKDCGRFRFFCWCPLRPFVVGWDTMVWTHLLNMKPPRNAFRLWFWCYWLYSTSIPCHWNSPKAQTRKWTNCFSA